MTPVLHGYWRSSAAFRVRIALNLKGVAYDRVGHNLRTGEQREAGYLALNPAGVVPTLAIDGLTLVQSLAICEYLEETRPEPSLLPKDPAGRARVRALALTAACDIHPLNNLRVLKHLKGELGQDQAAIDGWYRHWVEQGFDALEALLARSLHTGRFCHGDAPTLADVVLVPQAWNARRFQIALDPWPTLTRIVDEALTLPAFRDAAPENQPDADPGRGA